MPMMVLLGESDEREESEESVGGCGVAVVECKEFYKGGICVLCLVWGLGFGS